MPGPPPAAPALPAGWSGFPTTRQKSGFQKSGWRNSRRRITTSGLSRSPWIISCSAPGCRLAVSLFLLVKVISCSACQSNQLFGTRVQASGKPLPIGQGNQLFGARVQASGEPFLLVKVISCSAPGCGLAVSLFLLVKVISQLFGTRVQASGEPLPIGQNKNCYFLLVLVVCSALVVQSEVEFIKLKAAKIYRFLQLLSHSRGFFARV